MAGGGGRAGAGRPATTAGRRRRCRPTAPPSRHRRRTQPTRVFACAARRRPAARQTPAAGSPCNPAGDRRPSRPLLRGSPRAPEPAFCRPGTTRGRASPSRDCRRPARKCPGHLGRAAPSGSRCVPSDRRARRPCRPRSHDLGLPPGRGSGRLATTTARSGTVGSPAGAAAARRPAAARTGSRRRPRPTRSVAGPPRRRYGGPEAIRPQRQDP